MGLISRVSSRTYRLKIWERSRKREKTERTSFITWPKKPVLDQEHHSNFYNSTENSIFYKTVEYVSIYARLQVHGCKLLNKICPRVPLLSVLIWFRSSLFQTLSPSKTISPQKNVDKDCEKNFVIGKLIAFYTMVRQMSVKIGSTMLMDNLRLLYKLS